MKVIAVLWFSVSEVRGIAGLMRAASAVGKPPVSTSLRSGSTAVSTSSTPSPHCSAAAALSRPRPTLSDILALDFTLDVVAVCTNRIGTEQISRPHLSKGTHRASYFLYLFNILLIIFSIKPEYFALFLLIEPLTNGNTSLNIGNILPESEMS